MQEIQLKKKDIYWSYIAQFLSLGTGAITIPIILNKLSAPEIGLNYILVTIGSIIALIDLGFAPQFARNFTYIFSGAKELKKEGIGEVSENISYELLASLLKTARCIYSVLGIIAIFLLLIIGTPYLYYTTKGFTIVPNALLIWIIYSVGIFFQIYYSYYFSMLLGAGLIKEQKIAIISNKILYIIILLSFLFFGWGLLSVALAQMLSPFIGRWLSYKYFYTEDIRKELSPFKQIQRKKIIENFKILWYNAKRTAVMLVGAYAILRMNMFIAGLFMTLEEFGSYGLMVQLTGLLGSVANTVIQISQPKFASLRAKSQFTKLLSSFSVALLTSYWIYLIGGTVYVLWGNDILYFFKSNAILPNRTILLIYSIVIMLEYNHASFASLISANNNVPFAPASIITGIFICIGSFIILKYSTFGILGLVLVQGLCQGVYQNWKWPQYALREYNISYKELILLGLNKIQHKIRINCF